MVSVIDGFVINDLDCDGDLTEGEPGLSGVTVILRSGVCPGTTVLQTTTTGSDGGYSFTVASYGEYCVEAVVSSGCRASTENPASVKLDEGHPDAKLDFGICCETGSTCGRMTGGGSKFTVAGVRVTQGFEIHCNLDPPNNIEVNWGPGNRFHMTTLTSAVCTDDPAIIQNPPAAPFDTFTGTGTGKYNGQDGASISFIFVDAGEPGVDDHATITITWNGGQVLFVSNYIDRGNLQAHADNDCD